MKIEICFRLGQISVEDDTWNHAVCLPRINESIYLGGKGKYSWYTIKAINWLSASSVVFVLTNKRETVEV